MKIDAPKPVAAAFVGPKAPAGAEPGKAISPAMPPSASSPTPVAGSGVNPQVLVPGKLDPNDFQHALDGALALDPAAAWSVDSGTNSATFLSGNFTVEAPKGAVDATAADALATRFLGKYGGMFGVSNPSEQLKLVNTETDDLGMQHFKYQQQHKGLPVFGNEVIVHGRDDAITTVGGRLVPNIEAGTEARLDTKTAYEAARDALLGSPAVKELDGGFKPELGANTLGVYAPDGNEPRLAYELDVRNAEGAGTYRYYVDAENGSVLDNWSLLHDIAGPAKIETYDGKSTLTRPGTLVRSGDQAPTADAVANAAHDGARTVYDYFLGTHNRDSLDNRGMKLVSTVHHDKNLNNAFWDGRQMSYGDGDGKTFIPLAMGLDVIGHEMTHGVTEKTANLRYVRQSGALNESWSDVFGEAIEQWKEGKSTTPPPAPDWLIGEDVFTPTIQGDALRSMKAPGTSHPQDPQPDHMSRYKDITWDNGGVHVNSGIPNKAAYEAAQTIGTDKLGKIWYRALTNYLTAGSQFIDAANVTVQSASDIYGPTSAETQAVRDAWNSVGLMPAGSPPASAPPVAPTN